MLKELSGATHGVHFAVAADHEVRSDEADVAQWVDPRRSLAWHAFFAPGLTVDLTDASRASLARDVGAHALFLRDEMARSQPHEPSKHHPLVSCEVTSSALQVIHYMIRSAGLELVMGHLLVPVADGVLELRCVAKNLGTTGTRETAILMREMARQAGRDPEELMMSLQYNAPEEDAAFPDHVVSRVRDGLTWALGATKVERPAPPSPSDGVKLIVGCTVTPPPRFALHTDNPMIGHFARTSLAVNDGVQFLVIERAPHGPADQLREVIAAYELFVPEFKQQGAVLYADASPQVRAAVIEANAGGHRYLATVVTTAMQPLDAMVSELEAFAYSVR